ncbi:DUF2752 domain-containing protein [Selenomonas sp. ND2010]|jgi:hypothetical protein|uniref:DUF2752 domain-containing protein n=1 Tax=Selenomonas sp. ND2010 TaxID=1410618 RepID=UPI0006910B4A|nr:DUF2752 domain-containing protein [Selenomonas sp. ND2010]
MRKKRPGLSKWCLLIVGLIYLLSARYSFITLHCPIRTFTGFLCPGCGITTMFVRLSYGDFAGAYAANPVVLLLSPLILLLILHQYNPPKWSWVPAKILTWFCVVILLLWGIVRNL